MIPKFLQPEVLSFASVEILTARLTDTAPPAAVICAWCPTFDRAVPARGVTHGMCPACAATFGQEIG
jgi:hypothetical protein